VENIHTICSSNVCLILTLRRRLTQFCQIKYKCSIASASSQNSWINKQTAPTNSDTVAHCALLLYLNAPVFNCNMAHRNEDHTTTNSKLPREAEDSADHKTKDSSPLLAIQQPTYLTQSEPAGSMLLEPQSPLDFGSIIISESEHGNQSEIGTMHENDYGKAGRMLGELLEGMEPYLGKVQILWHVLFANALIVSCLLILSRACDNKIFHSDIFVSNSDWLLILANITIMISYSLKSFLGLSYV